MRKYEINNYFVTEGRYMTDTYRIVFSAKRWSTIVRWCKKRRPDFDTNVFRVGLTFNDYNRQFTIKSMF
jgi:hypothetical protein